MLDRSRGLMRPSWSLLLPVIGFVCVTESVSSVQEPAAAAPGVVASEFVFESAPFASAHASTIVETRDGLAAAWFGGTREGAADVGIWLSRRVRGKWTPPVEVATGVQPDSTRHPCWNPVLFEMPDKTLSLFYKVGPSPQQWWGMVRTSRDNGRTWSEARRLPDGILGPIKNKPVRLPDGTLLSSSSTESPGRPSTWRVHFERSVDGGRNWTAVYPTDSADSSQIHAIQPSILIHPGDRLQALGRTRSGRVFETWSSDRGRTWTPIALTALPNPNAGIDAVTVGDGRHLIVYNHTTQGRTPLNVSVSRDGTTWNMALVLEREPGEYSYPAVIQSGDGLVHVTYTWRRQRIKHVVIDPAKLKVSDVSDVSDTPEQHPAREAYAAVPGVRLWYTDTGGTGVPVVFMHAATGSSRNWEHQIPAFTAAGYRVIAYDRRGWGRTVVDAPHAQSGTVADDLEHLMDYLSVERFHLVGTAAGGGAALDYALAFPQRLRSLVIACSLGGVQDDDYLELGRRIRPQAFNTLPPELRELGPSYRATSAEGTRRWMELERLSRTEGAPAQAQPFRHRITFSLLETIEAPTLLITGEADMYVPPPLLRLFTARIRKSESLVVPEAGHSVYWEQPSIFNRAVLAFIRKH